MLRVQYSCLTDHDGNRAPILGWVPDKASYLPLLMLPDLGEVPLQYSFAGYVAQGSGVPFYALDCAMPMELNRATQAVLQAAAWIRNVEGGIAPIIAGQGIGAALAMRIAAEYPQFCQGFIAVAPPWFPRQRVGAVRRWIIRTMADFRPNDTISKWLCPQVSELLPVNSLTKHRFAFRQRTLRVSAALMAQALQTVDEVPGWCMRVKAPGLFLLPQMDPLYDHEAALTLLQGDSAKTVRLLPLTTHHPMLLSKEVAISGMAEICAWMAKVSDRDEVSEQLTETEIVTQAG